MDEQKFATLEELKEQTKDLPFEDYLEALRVYFAEKWRKENDKRN